MSTTKPSILDSRQPLYLAIQRSIRADIIGGALQPGDWLPSERELSQQYGASQAPVRRALLDLERLGLIQRLQGRGSIVATNEIRATSPMQGLRSELHQRGYQVTAKLISHSEQPAKSSIAKKLRIETGDSLHCLERRYCVDGEPLVYLTHYLPAHLGINFSEFNGYSLYTFLSNHKAKPTYAREWISAVHLSANEAIVLDREEAAAALRRERVAFQRDGRPVEYTRYLMRTDRYRLEIDLRETL